MNWSDGVKSDYVLWYAETKSPIKVQRLYRAKYGRNERTPQGREIKKWHKIFQEKSVVTPKKVRPLKVDPKLVLQLVEQKFDQSLRRMGNRLVTSKVTVKRCLKNEGVRIYNPQIMQALKRSVTIARVSFAQLILCRVSLSPNFLESLMFSDEAVFQLDEGINNHNCSHWKRANHHRTIEKPLNSSKVMVWAAVGVIIIIRPFFITENVSGKRYRNWLTEKFYPAYSATLMCQNSTSCRIGLNLICSSLWETGSIRTWLTVGSELDWLGDETENGDWACWCSHRAINYSWENWVFKYKILTIWKHVKAKVTQRIH